MSPPPKLSRRTVTIGGIAAGGAAVIAGAVYEVPKLFKPRLHGEYAELVGKLSDPEKAAVVGRISDRSAAIRARPLEQRCHPSGRGSFAKNKQARETEADGWVLPETLATVCALAAQAVDYFATSRPFDDKPPSP